MYIKELELIGFKSFQQKATLRFAPGMNAIVGPNGCGKSNILDALRWVLGEQSFSVLRCARNEDLVFGGTAQVPALNMAEVRLVLSTDELPELGAEVEIRRRYFRSGESEYYLNRQPCRLRDILDTFLTAGIGTKAYSIFDLRQIREIVAGNVRRMFEEAAQLAKYQEAKADCTRKLELTATDLVRLDDIIAERERVVRSLRRQAGKLRAYQRLKEEEKGFRLVELKLEHESVVRELGQAQADATALEQADAERLAAIHRLEEELRGLRSQVRERQAQRESLLAEARRQRATLAGLEGQSLLDRQRAELLDQAAGEAEAERQRQAAAAAQMEKLFAETLERLKAAGMRLTGVQARLDGARELTSGLETKLYELRSHEAALREQARDLLSAEQADRASLARFEATQENLAEGLERQRQELAAVSARAERARAEAEAAGQRSAAAGARVAELQARVEGLRSGLAGVREGLAGARDGLGKLREERARLEQDLAVLRQAAATEQARHAADVLGNGLTGEVSSYLEVSDGWERACEAALYQVLDFIYAARGVTGGELARLADAGPALRYGFVVPRPAPVGRFDVPQDRAIAGRLSDYVKVRASGPALLSRLLASFLVVREGADIEALAQAHAGWNFVTAVGVVRFADGRVVMEGEGRGRLSAERKTRRLNQRLAEVQSAFGGMEASEGSLRQRQVTLEEELGRAEAELAESGRERAGLDATNAAATGVLDDLAAEQARAGAEVHNLEAQLRAAAEKAEPLRQRLAEADSRNASVGRALSAAGMAVAEHEGRVKVALADSAEALAELGEEQQQVSRLEAEQTFAKRTLDDARRKAAGLESGGRQQRQEAAQLRQAADGRASAIEQARQAVEGVEAQAEGLAAAAAAGAEDELERNIAELRHAQERNQRLLMDQRMRRYDLEKQAAAMAEEARASHGTDIGAVAALPGEDFEQRYAAVRRRLEALGAVNPLAAEEFEQERKDLGRLAGQRDDVAQAKVNLEQTMLELDRHAREQFVQTYGEVRLHFQEIFRALFLDGEADLVLVNEASPLESEIAITARPKGKTPKRLEQLSDGEKALLAVSLLFAFYRVKPAPFCFLDEVDAPLDDVNVGRFADYLKGISGLTQVIIITHNRATVERAAALFGVTAEQPGISQLVSVSLAQFSEQRREPEPEN